MNDGCTGHDLRMSGAAEKLICTVRRVALNAMSSLFVDIAPVLDGWQQNGWKRYARPKIEMDATEKDEAVEAEESVRCAHVAYNAAIKMK